MNARIPVADADVPVPDFPARRIVLATVEQTFRDATSRCSGSPGWCLRFDALRAARSDWLREMADVVGLASLVDAIAALPDCAVEHPASCCSLFAAGRTP
jgi:hypothetical protein